MKTLKRQSLLCRDYPKSVCIKKLLLFHKFATALEFSFTKSQGEAYKHSILDITHVWCTIKKKTIICFSIGPKCRKIQEVMVAALFMWHLNIHINVMKRC